MPLKGEKKKQRERESDVGIGRGRRAGGGTVFTFESNSQLTRIVIRFANEAVRYYKFAKSSNVRENGAYRRQLDERSRRYFRHDVGGWRAVSRHQG